MTDITKADADRVLLSSFASIARREACDPIGSRNLSLYVNGDHAQMTRDRVAQTLGHEAAELWEAMRKSVEAFNAAVERRLTEKQYDGPVKIGRIYNRRGVTVRVLRVYWCDRGDHWIVSSVHVGGWRAETAYSAEERFIATATLIEEAEQCRPPS